MRERCARGVVRGGERDVRECASHSRMRGNFLDVSRAIWNFMFAYQLDIAKEVCEAASMKVILFVLPVVVASSSFPSDPGGLKLLVRALGDAG